MSNSEIRIQTRDVAIKSIQGTANLKYSELPFPITR